VVALYNDHFQSGLSEFTGTSLDGNFSDRDVRVSSGSSRGLAPAFETLAGPGKR